MKILQSLCRIVIAAAVGLALLSGAVSIGVTRYGTHRLARAADYFEARHGALDPGSYRPDPVPRSENGALLMAMAGSRIKLKGQTSDMVALASIRARRDWSQEMVEVVARVSEEHRDALALLHIASSLPAADFSPSEQSTDGTAANFILGLLSGARILATNARNQFVAHDVDAFERNVKSLGAVAAALSRDLDLNYQMAGWTAENLLLNLAAEVVESPQAGRRELLALREAGGTTNLMQNFRRYLSWRTAMAVGGPLRGKVGPDAASVDPDHPAPNPIDQRMLAVTRELRAALEIEEYHAAIDRLLLPAAGRDLTAASGEELFSEINLAAGRVQTTDASRRVVSAAVQLRLLHPPRRNTGIASLGSAQLPLTGEGLLITEAADGRCLVTIRGAKERADHLFFGRFNPTPPLQIMVPADRAF